MLWNKLREEIDATLARDPAAGSRLEAALCCPGYHALICHRVAHWLWRRRWLLAGRFVSYVARAWTSTEIHPGARWGSAAVVRVKA
jgi:serine O-acetyltransferase